MRPLFPSIQPYAEHTLPVDDTHLLYVEECGNPDGLPVLFIHGGPGAGCSADDRRFFDPEQYRIILFDQRGCGRSTPHASLENNTTAELIADIEKIRAHLHVSNWLLFGGSWGSTLSLLYAQQHPNHVLGLILRGIFLCRQQDIDWIYRFGANQLFPDTWQTVTDTIGHSEDILQHYYDALQTDDELARLRAAKAWSLWEGTCATLTANKHVVSRLTQPHTAIAFARISTHFFQHHCFIEENQILQNMARIAHLPAIIVHGRYDALCTLASAFDLQKKWPNSELHIIRNAGHASCEPGTTDALIRATHEMAKKLNIV